MEILKIINPENIDTENLSGWRHRRAARAVVFDDKNRIGLLHVRKYDYYKLPGGGIKNNEDIKIALDRECEEELGVEIQITKELGIIEEYRPKIKLHQTSYCFLAKAGPERKPPSFSKREKSSEFEAIWVKPDEALELFNSKQSVEYTRKFVRERDLYFLKKALKLN